MRGEDQKEALACKLYEARHPSPEFPTWKELHRIKTYKLVKYRQLAEVAITFLLRPSKNAVGTEGLDLDHAELVEKAAGDAGL